MKLIFILSLIAIAYSQTPIPIPNLNLNNLAGVWYIVWEFSSSFNNSVPTPVSCWNFNLTNVTSNSGILRFSETLNGQSIQGNVNFTTTGSGNSVWNINGNNFAWIAVDPISGSYGTLASENSQTAFIVSRNANISNLVLNAQIVILKGEGYQVNTSNQYSLPSTSCN